MIPFIHRFHGHNSLTFVYRHGQAVRSHMATVKFVSNSHRHESRIAVVVSKKIFKSAVKRNRIRRRIYEYIRPRLDQLATTYDIVVIVTTQEFLTMPYSELVSEFDHLFHEAHLYKASEN